MQSGSIDPDNRGVLNLIPDPISGSFNPPGIRDITYVGIFVPKYLGSNGIAGTAILREEERISTDRRAFTFDGLRPRIIRSTQETVTNWSIDNWGALVTVKPYGFPYEQGIMSKAQAEGIEIPGNAFTAFVTPEIRLKQLYERRVGALERVGKHPPSAGIPFIA